ncbi:MAG: hypothetical protein KHX55_07340 [Proteobacteria bacterium]|nr:hypothetical protein [Pseudomonadota bacterium]
MEWKRKGLIFCPKGENDWDDNSFLQPTPLVLEDRIRVFGGFRDKQGRSRVGYVDLDKNDPQNILKYATHPALDIGKEGRFDENGVTPAAVIRRGSKLYLYYAGYSLGTKVRFTVFTGLAVSSDNGEHFERYQETPITERVKTEELFRVIHSIFEDDGVYKAWYGGGNTFLQGEHKTLPVYDIRYMESADGFSFPDHGTLAIPVSGECHRVGRPYVFKENGLFKIYYGYGSEEKPYQLAYAESKDGVHWEPREINLPLADSGWDSQMMAYPSFVRANGKGYLFYNGNNYGREGFGLAELIEE